MPTIRFLRFVLLFGAVLIGTQTRPALAADAFHAGCLSPVEQRAALARHEAIPLAQALGSWRATGARGDLVRARLCRRANGLQYVLTLLARNGKVTRATIDASNGSVISGR